MFVVMAGALFQAAADHSVDSRRYSRVNGRARGEEGLHLRLFDRRLGGACGHARLSGPVPRGNPYKRYVGGQRSYAEKQVLGCDLYIGLHAKRVLTAAITWGNASSPENFKKLYSAALRGDIRNHKQYYKSGLTYSCTQRLKEIPLPTLLLYGKKDSGFHKYAKMLHRQLPNSTLHFIPKAKHQLPTKWAGPTNS